ncbi:AAA family ATPase [Nonomuraea sp. NPDC049152]|uniref:AAA family ATPase n=1 Tax=Nonomuraea sp. NPDC049152 TaxID=3154350 RepID=UPI0033D11270
MTVRGAIETLRYPAKSLVIVTGLPGAGKTTLLRRLYGMDGTESVPFTSGHVTVIDSGQSRARWTGRLRWAPKPVRTGVVFATHVWRIRRGLSVGGSVIAHNRGCGPRVLRAFAWLARRHSAELHLLLLDAPPEVALAGQYARGRVVPTTTFTRHRRHWHALLGQVRAGDPRPALGAHVLDRAGADRLIRIAFDDHQGLAVSGG